MKFHEFFDLDMINEEEIIVQAIEEVYRRNALDSHTAFEKLSAVEQFNVKLMKFRLDCIDEGMLYQDYLTTGIYQSNYTAYVNDTLYEVKIACSPLPQFAIVDIDTSDTYNRMVDSEIHPVEIFAGLTFYD